MNPIPCLVAVALLAVGAAVAGEPAPAAPAAPCSSAEHRQFDFWLGEWTVTTPDGKLAGHNRITSILGGCALREEWSGAGGGSGTSTNVYDATRGVWHQTWVDAQGSLLVLEGGLRDGAMVLEGRTRGREGKTLENRVTWTPAADGSVRQVWDVSRDGGSTWKTVFDGLYRRSD